MKKFTHLTKTRTILFFYSNSSLLNNSDIQDSVSKEQNSLIFFITVNSFSEFNSSIIFRLCFFYPEKIFFKL